MFERYTEKARRVIFFAHYEASQFGSPTIDVEHLLLGLLREDPSLRRWFPKTNAETIRQVVYQNSIKGPPTSTAVDMPLSAAATQVLKTAGEEAERLARKHVGTEHLLLGLIEEKDSFAAEVLLEAGADPTAIRAHYAEKARQPQAWSFQSTSHPIHGFRTLSAETVEIHGARWNVDYVRDAINFIRAYNWHWQKAPWKPRDIVVSRKTGAFSFDLSLAADADNFALVREGWKKDHCYICRWEVFEPEVDSDAEHATGYTNGHDWLCMECYERFWENLDFFLSSHSDIT